MLAGALVAGAVAVALELACVVGGGAGARACRVAARLGGAGGDHGGRDGAEHEHDRDGHHAALAGEAAGEVRFAQTEAERDGQRPQHEQPAGDVKRDFALLGGEHGRELGRESVHGASLTDAPADMLAGGMDGVRRTADDALEGLPDFPFAAHYREVDGLRLAHIDEGEGAPVIFIHGEPTWSFLWRKVIVPVRDAGYRCIAPDLAGFGRSDKPTDVGWYSYDRHTALAATLLEDLDLQGATIVVHDWGGPIGLRLASSMRRGSIGS